MLSRRDMLIRTGLGIGGVGLAQTMAAAEPVAIPPGPAGAMGPKAPHFAPRAQRIIHLFMNGGPSHIDTFDPKPLLERYAGLPLPDGRRTERQTRGGFPSPFPFRKRGQSGLEISDLFPHVAQFADDMTVIRSMVADVPNHEPSFLLMNCGENRQPRPSMGSWLMYGLGTENQNLPGFVVMCPGGLPTVGAQNWRSAFLPGGFQGTYVDTKHTEVHKLIEHIRNEFLPRDRQRRQMDLLREMNRRHLAQREGDLDLEARLESFELAYRMQIEATDAFDVTREPQSVRETYGDTVYGRQLLMARRLLERGVRVVQVWQGAGQPWDAHDDLETNHRKLARECDQPIGALLADLKSRGMLDSTLVLWGGEFGRTPTAELPTPGVSSKGNGRDHNHYGFSVWMAGGGVKGGYAHGATDDLGWATVRDRVHVHDLHATILHLLGLDHTRLTYRLAGRDFRLTDIHGDPVLGVIA